MTGIENLPYDYFNHGGMEYKTEKHRERKKRKGHNEIAQ
jgi:hypothetical protein